MLQPVQLTYGTDPELFFQRRGRIIGAEKVLPEAGLISSFHGVPFVVLDGVQCELNPPQSNTPVGVGNNISTAFKLLKQHLTKASNAEVTCCFNRIVEVSRQELNSLSEKSRILGCLPSLNVYGVKPLKCNRETYRKRSPGGHVHVGLQYTNIYSDGRDERSRLIPLYDILVSNFCVLLDRDPGAAERRENYGRAGEFRLPGHGVEYRTPDNFWLRNYALMDFVFGMTNFATSVLVETLYGNDLEQELVDIVNIKRVIKAINNNDIDLAKRNIQDLQPWLARNLPDTGFPLRPGSIPKFIELGDVIEKHGIDSVFPDPVLVHWTVGNRVEFATFLEA